MPKMRGFLKSKPKIDKADWEIAQIRTAARLGDMFGSGAAPSGKDASPAPAEDETPTDLSSIVVGTWPGGPRPPIVVVGVSEVASVLEQGGVVEPKDVATEPEPVPPEERELRRVVETIAPAKPIGVMSDPDADARAELASLVMVEHDVSPANPIGVMARADETIWDETWRLPAAGALDPEVVPSSSAGTADPGVAPAPAAHVFANRPAPLVDQPVAPAAAKRVVPAPVPSPSKSLLSKLSTIRGTTGRLAPDVIEAAAEAEAPVEAPVQAPVEVQPEGQVVASAPGDQRRLKVRARSAASTTRAAASPTVATAQRRATRARVRPAAAPVAPTAEPAAVTEAIVPGTESVGATNAAVEANGTANKAAIAPERRVAAPERRVSAPVRQVVAAPVKRAKRTAAPRPTATPAARTGTTSAAPAHVRTAYCPYCAKLLEPTPKTSRRCERCRQRIVVKRIDGLAVYLTEAAVLVFEAERRRVANSARWAKERDRWLDLASSAGASAERRAQLASARLTEDVVAGARKLYMTAVERAFRTARRERDWDEAARLRRDQATVLHRIAGSPTPPLAVVVALFHEGVAAELRGVAEISRDAELVSARCCDACRADDRVIVRITRELREPRLPHAGCPRGLCRCHWDLATRDRMTMRRYLRRRPGAEARLGQVVGDPGEGAQS